MRAGEVHEVGLFAAARALRSEVDVCMIGFS
jgi:hypothetical protein